METIKLKNFALFQLLLEKYKPSLDRDPMLKDVLASHAHRIRVADPQRLDEILQQRTEDRVALLRNHAEHVWDVRIILCELLYLSLS